ncbi:isoprenylcysteine carboxylmethyltransferase family protein [Actinoplanes sp. NBC_00393]|uniref:methyltransferase family protein n=1 Tax=Actinoplanes sp. NBC_00393 TaxID=2975953 RepID=UPI002E1DD338
MTVSAVAALVVFVLAMVAAFGWRTVVQLRTTGDTGLRLDAGPIGSAGWWGKLLFIGALLLAAAAPVLAFTGAVRPLVWHPGLAMGGLIIAVAGIAVTLTAQWQMGASWRIGVDQEERTTLVTAGLFAHLRNPIFTGMLAVLAGLTGMVPSLIMLTALPSLLAAVQIQVRVVEEPYLLTTHGPAYRDYAQRAGRFLPAVGRLTSG